jgi:SlyX protein
MAKRPLVACCSTTLPVPPAANHARRCTFHIWSTPHMTDNRLVEIEIKIARQEDLLDHLNQTIYRQQKKLDELEALCAALARHIKTMQQAASEHGAVNEKPPHY